MSITMSGSAVAPLRCGLFSLLVLDAEKVQEACERADRERSDHALTAVSRAAQTAHLLSRAGWIMPREWVKLDTGGTVQTALRALRTELGYAQDALEDAERIGNVSHAAKERARVTAAEEAMLAIESADRVLAEEEEPASTTVELENRYVRAVLTDVVCDWIKETTCGRWEPQIGFTTIVEGDEFEFIADNLAQIEHLNRLGGLLRDLQEEDVRSVRLPKDREAVAKSVRICVDAARGTLEECPSERLNGRVVAIQHAESLAESLAMPALAEAA